jgi:excisionase family DNA binding protein
MTVNEFIKKYEVSRRTVYRWIEDGKLPATKMGDRWDISNDIDIDNVISDTNQLMTELRQQIAQLKTENEYLRQELSQERQRHDEAQKQSNTIIMQLTKQLEQQTLMLEDMRHRSIWRRLKEVFAPVA